MKNITDEQFMLFKMGNERVFDIIYDLYYDALEYYAYNIIKDRKEAEDIAIISLTALWENKEKKIENKEMIEFYLYKVARNKCIDFLRKSKNKSIILAAIARQQKMKEDDFFRLQEQSEIIKELVDILNNSDDKFAIVVRLSYLEGERNNDIAGQINASEQNVSQIKRRAIASLRKLLNLILCSSVLVTLTNNPAFSKKISHLVSFFHDLIVLLTR